jgi:peptide/nickel transport system ATP-binding protein
VNGSEARRDDAVALLQLVDVSKYFARRLDMAARIVNLLGRRAPTVVRAVDHVDLTIREREVVGLVGESGCGKTTLGRIAAGLLPPSDGERLWRGAPLTEHAGAGVRPQQLKTQMVFQDPHASLNPRMKVLDIVGEAPVVHGLISRQQQVEYVGLQLNRVGLDPTLMRRFAHQFSGGQRARIGIARALAVKPEFLVCDEPVAALDVSIQAQVLNLFMDLRSALNLTYLFISHDLAVVRYVSDHLLVMYLGRIVESGPTAEIFAQPNHPYTQGLLRGVGGLEAGKQTYIPIQGEIPSPLSPPSGCHFHPRCPYVMPQCRVISPALKKIGPERWSACHLNNQDESRPS